MTQDEGSFDDFMDGIGLDVKPLSPEDALMIKMKGGGFNELNLLRYWLIHELHAYYDLLKNGAIYMRRNRITNELVTFRKEEYVEVRIKYYLQMKYLPWFNRDMSGIGVANLDTMAKMLLEHELIQALMSQESGDLPKLSH